MIRTPAGLYRDLANVTPIWRQPILFSRFQVFEHQRDIQGLAHLKAETENGRRLTDVVGLILKGTAEGLS